MMSKPPLFVLALFNGLVLTLSPMHEASAADQVGPYATMGIGVLSCGAYNEARKKGTDRSFTIWIGGYITTTNYNLKDTNDIAGSTDLDGMMGWLDNWCQANPTKNFAYAAWHLVNFLYPSRKRRE
jgi:hypothetical protein